MNIFVNIKIREFMYVKYIIFLFFELKKKNFKYRVKKFKP